ncbi:branched-chain amino acid ABC transporter permease [Streptomyces sp. NPDC091972]|uniref:branched-chain amino acid ABC transporter permease n=1 Tax=Streptomyces sp. NPDC091972 TaxID=3366007 RepID=UPI0038297AD4
MTLLLQTVIFGCLVGGVYALMSSGFTLIFGVMNVINLAHGSMIVLGAYVSWWLWHETGLDPLLLGLCACVPMAAVGWLLYKAVVAQVQRIDPGLTLVATFAFSMVGEGVITLIWGNSAHASTPGYFTTSYHLGSLAIPKAQFYACLGALAVLGALFALLHRTFLGRAIRACASSRSGAELIGVNVEQSMAQMFALGVATTGFGGAALSVLYQFTPDSQDIWIGRVLCVVVLGGLGSLAGAALGAVLLGLGETLTSTYWSVSWTTSVPYMLILAVLLLRPQGLFGATLRREGSQA